MHLLVYGRAECPSTRRAVEALQGADLPFHYIGRPLTQASADFWKEHGFADDSTFPRILLCADGGQQGEYGSDDLPLELLKRERDKLELAKPWFGRTVDYSGNFTHVDLASAEANQNSIAP